MIIIGGPLLFLIFLCMFKPVRFVLGWLLFIGLCCGVYACAVSAP